MGSLVSAELARRSNTVRVRRRPGKYKIIALIILSVLVTSAVVGFTRPKIVTDILGGSYCDAPNPYATSSTSPRIALIDQISFPFQNPDIIENVSTLASQAGYGFDYYAPDKVTLDMMVNLPRMGYSMIILRTHGGDSQIPAITVSDPYSQYGRLSDQLQNRLAAVNLNGSSYFGILPGFITQVMCGQFPGTLILSMGCATLSNTDLAGAFVKKGARAFIGWDRAVDLTRTDQAFELLVQFLLQGNGVAGAVQKTALSVGPDPTFNSTLSYYPS